MLSHRVIPSYYCLKLRCWDSHCNVHLQFPSLSLQKWDRWWGPLGTHIYSMHSTVHIKWNIWFNFVKCSICRAPSLSKMPWETLQIPTAADCCPSFNSFLCSASASTRMLYLEAGIVRGVYSEMCFKWVIGDYLLCYPVSSSQHKPQIIVSVDIS